MKRRTIAFAVILINFFVSVHAEDAGSQFRNPPSQLKSIKTNSAISGIFGPDSRTRLPAKYRHLSKSIGYLHYSDNNKYTRCTVFCIADDIIATSGHCFFNRDFSPPTPFSRSTFAIGAGKRRVYSTIRGKTWTERHASIITGCAGLSCSSPTVQAKQLDWAIARLEKPICEGRILDLYTSENAVSYVDWLSKDRLFTLSYPGDKSYRRATYAADCSDRHNETYLSAAASINFFFNYSRLAIHRCDSLPGMSGAPLFLSGDAKGVSVLGVNSGLMGFGTPPDRFLTNLATRSSAFHRQVALLKKGRPLLESAAVRKIQTALQESGVLPQRDRWCLWSGYQTCGPPDRRGIESSAYRVAERRVPQSV